jgi:hypothetical protein
MKDENLKELTENWEDYYKYSQETGSPFSGPSLYFHSKSISECKDNYLSESHIEYIYATLASWGMHRMGPGGAKMTEFDIFKDSILKKRELLTILNEYNIDSITKDQLQRILPALKFCLRDIKATTTGSWLVSSSKTLAHLLPNITPPIDRTYTLCFYGIHGQMSDDDCDRFYSTIMNDMWHFFQNKDLLSKIKIDNQFNTSYPKIFDNLIIAYKKNNDL